MFHHFKRLVTTSPRSLDFICFFVLLLVEAVEHACGVATLKMGEFVPNASNGIDTFCIREPLGVCAGICPSNFPAMIPLWVCLPDPCFLSCVLVLHHLSCLDIGCCKLLNIVMLPLFVLHHLLGYLMHFIILLP